MRRGRRPACRQLPGVVLAVVGLVLAHATNNLINDYFDMTGGVDTEGYVRALYAPHPVLSGWITKRQLCATRSCSLTAIDGLIMLVLAATNQQPLLVIAFALAGLFLSVFYVAPPLNLKRHGLGELDVFLTWGPLMIGGRTWSPPGRCLYGCSSSRSRTRCS